MADAAIGATSNRRAVLNTGTGSGFVWVELNEFVLMSSYYSPNISLDHFARNTLMNSLWRLTD